jgi:hypothetical protein
VCQLMTTAFPLRQTRPIVTIKNKLLYLTLLPISIIQSSRLDHNLYPQNLKFILHGYPPLFVEYTPNPLQRHYLHKSMYVEVNSPNKMFLYLEFCKIRRENYFNCSFSESDNEFYDSIKGNEFQRLLKKDSSVHLGYCDAV